MDEQLIVKIDCIDAFGTVVWSDCGECGIDFDPRLEPAEEEYLRNLVETARGLPPEIRAAFENWVVGAGR